MRYAAPRGTEDVLPSQAAAWRRIESTFRETARLYGYSEIRTPTFEDTDLFIRSSGETSDIVSKQMYTFTDKGDRSLTLKPEGTAPAMRSVIENNLCPPGSVTKLYYITPFFRYERPQKGRMREGHQVGLELLGSSSVLADAEIIELTVRFFEAIGITGLSAQINSIGRAECRAKYQAVILDHVANWLKDQESEVRARAEKNPMRLLDSKDPEMQVLLANLAPITDFLEPESKVRFEQLQTLLTEANIAFSLDTKLVRGLDYYTETVFEIASDKIGSQSALCGGGRYDGLIKAMGGPDTPAVGMGSGIERLLLVCEAMGIQTEEDRPKVFLVCAGEAAEQRGREIARELRAQNVATVSDLDSRSLKAQIRQADKIGAKYAVIIGDDELSANQVTVRRLSDSTQEPVAFDVLSEYLERGD